MKLGKDTASLHNWIMSTDVTKPEVGKGMLQLLWTDRRVWEVVDVISDKEIRVKPYNPKYNQAGYVSELGEPIGEGVTLKFSRGSWRFRDFLGKWVKMNVVFGSHMGYRDPSF